MELYRSGHNEAVLKTVCLHGHQGSNPCGSAKDLKALPISEGLSFENKRSFKWLYAVFSGIFIRELSEKPLKSTFLNNMWYNLLLSAQRFCA